MSSLTDSRSLPIPGPAALQHSARVKDYIVREIHKAGGMIPFAEFMQHALYAPGLGYYSAGATKFGPTGDFITAPEISPLFSQCLARYCQPVLQSFENATILELGAGSGVMAADLLLQLEQDKSLPARYLILEVSADLRARQRMTIEEKCPHLLPRVSWQGALPSKPFSGVILGNEVLDAMPVQRFCWDAGRLQAYGVSLQDGELVGVLVAPDDALVQAVTPIYQEYLTSAERYCSEINLMVAPWLRGVSECLQQGMIVFIDYGFLAHEYYHPQRNTGTLMCHYRHHVHPNPFLYPGLQDITAHVDFSRVIEGAQALGLEVVAFTTQANFLLGLGIDQLIAEKSGKEYYRLAQALKKLVLPSEMGEIFKVLSLQKY